MRRSILLFTVCFLVSVEALAAPVAPIKLKPYAVTASSTYGGASPAYATDGNPSTAWNAGSLPTQWIQIDLGRTVAIQQINFLPSQAPNGQTTHVIDVATIGSGTWTRLGSISQVTYDNQWFAYRCDFTNKNCGNVRFIRITTTQGPSWVAWREIEIEQSLAYFGFFGDGAFENSIASTTGKSAGQGGANLAMVGGDMAGWLDQVKTARANGAQVILAPTIFVTDSNGRYYLRPDWGGDLNHPEVCPGGVYANCYWPQVWQFIRQNWASIVAVYEVDEPYNRYASVADVAAVADRIRRDTSDINRNLPHGLPVAAILSPMELAGIAPNHQVDHVSMFDWLGYDCYGHWDSCANVPMDTWNSYLDSILNVDKTGRPQQRKIAVPSAYSGCDTPWPQDTLWTDWEIIQPTNKWNQQVLQDPGYILVMPFRWVPMVAGMFCANYGKNQAPLPYLQQRMRRFADSMLRPDSTVYTIAESAEFYNNDSNPYLAFDGLSSSVWNSGGLPPQTITVDLGGSTHVGQFDFNFAMTPAGTVTLTVQGMLAASGQWANLTKATFYASEGYHWSSPLGGDYTQVRFMASQGPSWVAAHEITMSR